MKVPLGPVGAAAELVTRTGHIAAAHAENNIARTSLEHAIDQQLLNGGAEGVSHDAITARAESERAKAEAAAFSVEQRQRTYRLGMKVVAGIAGGVLLVGGGIAGAVIYESKQAYDQGVGTVNNGIDAIKKALTPQDISAIEIQNVVNHVSFPGLDVNVEQADLSGSTNLHVQKEIAGHIGWGLASDTPAVVCGANVASVNLGTPGVLMSASKEATGVTDLTVQVPLTAIHTYFIDKTKPRVNVNDTRDLPCTDPVSTPGAINSVGPSDMNILHDWEKDTLQANCEGALTTTLDQGIINSLRGVFNLGAKTEAALSAPAGSQAVDTAKAQYIAENLLTSATETNIKIVYVTPVASNEVPGGFIYTPIDINTAEISGVPAKPTLDRLANQLQISKDYLTPPAEEATQCLYTAQSTKDQEKAMANPQQLPETNPSTPVVAAAGASN